MTRFFVFDSEAEAEAFCTEGCPIFGKDLDGSEVQDKGVTTRLANWAKHPTDEKWLVKHCDVLDGKSGELQDFDEKMILPVADTPFAVKEDT